MSWLNSCSWNTEIFKTISTFVSAGPRWGPPAPPPGAVPASFVGSSAYVHKQTPSFPLTTQQSVEKDKAVSLRPAKSAGFTPAALPPASLPPSRLPVTCFTHTHIWRQRFLAGLSAVAPNSQRTLWRQRTSVKNGRGTEAAWDATGDTHLVFHVRGVKKRRSDGGFVRQRLSQERVVSFTWTTNKTSRLVATHRSVLGRCRL